MARKSVHMSLVGDKELIAKLNGLGAKVYRKVVAQASRKAFAPVVSSAKSNVVKDTGLLKKSIGIKQKNYPRAGRVLTIVGPRTGFGKKIMAKTILGNVEVFRDPVRYAHLVEYGTKAHAISQGDYIGAAEMMHPGTAARPFMRPAFDGNENRAKAIMRSELAAGVVREARSK